MADATKHHPDECPTCEGIGYVRGTATEYTVDTKTGVYRTDARGSGCPTCQGTGRRDANS